MNRGVSALAVAAAAASVGSMAFMAACDNAKPTAREHALRACAAADKFEAAVRRNDDIDAVRRHLNRARDAARKAEQSDSLYVGLASGIEALHVAIESNDGNAARVGMVVLRDECGFVERGVVPRRD